MISSHFSPLAPPPPTPSFSAKSPQRRGQPIYFSWTAVQSVTSHGDFAARSLARSAPRLAAFSRSVDSVTIRNKTPFSLWIIWETQRKVENFPSFYPPCPPRSPALYPLP
ncbi:hypothetical protein CDAR_286191 [Caerostris darwini]|uniref:Uncharacterized protein n=1 Tax=Caerostris darwini TaxID=1538125 RepID=A0AAV4N5Y4_9ARAC|nr:hypothetical protein CDAR_286191 [Caerostris darwini]